jgi:hypothetical protein
MLADAAPRQGAGCWGWGGVGALGVGRGLGRLGGRTLAMLADAAPRQGAGCWGWGGVGALGVGRGLGRLGCGGAALARRRVRVRRGLGAGG